MMDGQTEVIPTVKVMLIWPDQTISDKELLEIPKVGDVLRLNSRTYYVTEAHESVVEKIEGHWHVDWVVTLSQG